MLRFFIAAHFAISSYAFFGVKIWEMPRGNALSVRLFKRDDRKSGR
jgi:hypothetical protein